MNKIKVIFTDFDGVLTDNKVYVSSNGLESVCCTRSDGLAINALKKSGIDVIIVSTEINKVVKIRGKKLGVETFYGIKNKKDFIQNLINERKFSNKDILYLGNDINDLGAINIAKYSACPSDSHDEVKKKVSHILKSKGGEGVLRELTENFLNINLTKVLGYDDC